MKKSELEELISVEIRRQLKESIPRLVKPLVQEAVAGALASLLAEGISKGVPKDKQPQSPKILTPDVPLARHNKNTMVEDADVVRSKLRRRLQETQEPIGNFGGGMIGNILNETAGDMISGADVESILDADPYELEASVDSNVVRNITKDYSALMSRMNQPRS